MAENNVDILLLNETKVYTSKAINIKGYQSFPVFGKDRQGEGIFIGVFIGIFMDHMKLSWSVKRMMQTSLLYD